MSDELIEVDRELETRYHRIEGAVLAGDPAENCWLPPVSEQMSPQDEIRKLRTE